MTHFGANLIPSPELPIVPRSTRFILSGFESRLIDPFPRVRRNLAAIVARRAVICSKLFS